jgi:hypothetical protein
MSHPAAGHLRGIAASALWSSFHGLRAFYIVHAEADPAAAGLNDGNFDLKTRHCTYNPANSATARKIAHH